MPKIRVINPKNGKTVDMDADPSAIEEIIMAGRVVVDLDTGMIYNGNPQMYSELQSAVRGFGEGIALGSADEVAGIFDDQYAKDMRTSAKEHERQNPKAYVGGKTVGSTLTELGLTGLAARLGGARAAKAVPTITGTIQGAMDAEGTESRVAGALEGAAAGFLPGSLVSGLASPVKKIAGAALDTMPTKIGAPLKKLVGLDVPISKTDYEKYADTVKLRANTPPIDDRYRKIIPTNETEQRMADFIAERTPKATLGAVAEAGIRHVAPKSILGGVDLLVPPTMSADKEYETPGLKKWTEALTALGVPPQQIQKLQEEFGPADMETITNDLVLAQLDIDNASSPMERGEAERRYKGLLSRLPPVTPKVTIPGSIGLPGGR